MPIWLHKIRSTFRLARREVGDARRNPSGYSYIYTVYCPDHAEAAFEWRDKLADWKARRREQGKAAYTGFFGHLAEWGAKLLNRNVGGKVAEWAAENVKPIPPWETTP